VLREARAKLEREEPEQALAIQSFIDKVPDAESARQLNVNRFAMYRLRRSGVRTLRGYFAELGYKMPSSKPATLTWLGCK